MFRLPPRPPVLRRALLAAALAFAALPAPDGARAQNPFEPIIRVNDSYVTRFEIAQRVRLMSALRMPDTSRDAAEAALIEDRLKTAAAREAGIEPTREDIDFGVEDFAARAGLTAEEFLLALNEGGIAPETVREFVDVSISWGELLSERFTARARPSEAEIDRAIALGEGAGGARILVSEIILPIDPELAQVTQERALAISQIEGFAAFEAAARRFSVAPSAANGGRLDWRPLNALPQEVASRFLALSPGDVTDPVLLGDRVALYQLRALEDVVPQLNDNAELDYAVLRLAQGESVPGVLATLAARTDGCADLYTVYPGASEARLQRITAERETLPASVTQVLDLLDPGEAAPLPAAAAPGSPGAVAMLCTRSVLREEDLSREQVARQLFVRRIEALGDSFLEQLRADARIETLN